MTIALDKGSWRLTFGTTPVKLVARGGTFEPENSTAWETYIIRAEDLETYVALAFPSPLLLNNFSTPRRNKAFPGFPQLALKRLTWKSHVEGLPVDPFGADTSDPNFDQTYCGDIQIDLEYGTTPYNSGDPTGSGGAGDASTFLTISASGAGEYINAPARGTSRWGKLDPSEKAEVLEANMPLPIPQPLVEWSAKWPQVPFDWFKSTYLAKLRYYLGRVNNKVMKPFGNAPIDTMLFVGWSMQSQFTWRDGNVGRSPVQLEFKFLEKNFESVEGVAVDHQYMYRPGFGFRLLTVNGLNLFPGGDLNKLFEP